VAAESETRWPVL